MIKKLYTYYQNMSILFGKFIGFYFSLFLGENIFFIDFCLAGWYDYDIQERR